MDKNKLILPIAIIIASTILGGFFYAIQINKQNSIEQQQWIKLQDDKRVEEEKTKKERADKNFTNNLKCQDLLKDLKQRWNNIAGIYYSEYLNTCMVKYTEKGEVHESPLEDMQDNN